MSKFIDTPRGKIEIMTCAGVDTDDVLVADVGKIRDILQDPQISPGVIEQWLVHDEDEFMRRLRERYANSSC